MSQTGESEAVGALRAGASVRIEDLDEHSCVVRIDTGQLVVGGIYLFRGFDLAFLAGRVDWAHGSRAGLFFKHPIHAATLSQIRAATSSANDASATVYLESI